MTTQGDKNKGENIRKKKGNRDPVTNTRRTEHAAHPPNDGAYVGGVALG